jgi:N-acetylmuramoyl-L-alanine amidase
MKNYCVLIDPGHGGIFSGAVAGGVKEKDITLGVSYQLFERLREKGIHALMTRMADHELKLDLGADLQERCNIEHKIRPALFISLHCNAASSEQAHGFEVFTSPGETPSDATATNIYTYMQADHPDITYRTDYSDGDPDKEANFAVLTGTRGPAVLVELGFLTNPEERKRLTSPHYTGAIAETIAEAIIASPWLFGR